MKNAREVFFKIAALGILITAPPGSATAQSSGLILDEIRDAFGAVEYTRLDSLAEVALARYDEFAPDALVEIHSLLGLAHYYRENEAGARDQFEAALSLSPDLTFDVLLVPPHAIQFFEEVRAAFPQRSPVRGEAAAARYVIIHDPRPAAAVRSFVLPGWGQWHKGDRTRALVFSALWVGTIGGGIAAHLAHDRARELYELADVDAVAGRYDTMNRYHKLRKYLAFGAAGVWMISALDAVVSGGPSPSSGSAEMRGVALSIGPRGVPSITYRRRF